MNDHSLPVLSFIQQLMREQFPQLDVGEGSVLYQTFIYPSAIMLQPFRDMLNVLKRNMSLKYYEDMTDNELDALAINFFVTRNIGTKSFHTQRVFFRDLHMVNITSAAVFSDDSGRKWYPVSVFSVTAPQLALNIDSVTGEYYVDVPVVAEQNGEQFIAEPNQVGNVFGISGATRTTNILAGSGGKNDETNTEIFNRMKSISNRTLTSRDGIKFRLMESFPAIRTMAVLGKGDQGLSRDLGEVALNMEPLFSRSMCDKVNVPLDADGNVKWTDEDDNVIVTPAGGWSGAITDTTGLDFFAINITLDGTTYRKIAIQPGMVLRLYEDSDDAGDYTVVAVEEEPIQAFGSSVKIVRVNKIFSETTSTNYPYTILGTTISKSFHLGGCSDCYVDTVNDIEKSVTISALQSGSLLDNVGVGGTVTDPAAYIPLSPEQLYWTDEQGVFENGVPFQLPVIAVKAVYEMDNGNNILRELVQGADWTVTRAEYRQRFSTLEYDMLTIYDAVGKDLVGTKIKVVYITNSDIPLIQNYVQTGENKPVFGDILIKAPTISFLNVEVNYSSDALDSTDANTILNEYIKSNSFGGVVTSADINNILYTFGATDIKMPITLRVRRQNPSGTVSVESSTDRISTSSYEKLLPETTLSVTRI